MRLGLCVVLEVVVERTFLSSGEAGNTDKSAPVSTKKERPDSLSITDNAPTTLESMDEMVVGAPGVNPSRRWRFRAEGDG